MGEGREELRHTRDMEGKEPKLGKALSTLGLSFPAGPEGWHWWSLSWHLKLALCILSLPTSH